MYPDDENDYKYYRGHYPNMGRKDQIEALEHQLAKHVAMRDQTPMVGVTNSGNIGVYGAHGGHVISVVPSKLDTVINLLQSIER